MNLFNVTASKIENVKGVKAQRRGLQR